MFAAKCPTLRVPSFTYKKKSIQRKVRCYYSLDNLNSKRLDDVEHDGLFHVLAFIEDGDYGIYSVKLLDDNAIVKDDIVAFTNFEDAISIRIAIGSGTAFLVAQLVDIEIFQSLRNKVWFIAPMTSSIFGSIIDTFLFFSISFLGTGVPWVSLAFGDLFVKLLMSLLMLIPFRLLIIKIRDLNASTSI